MDQLTEVMLIDDSMADLTLMKEAFKENKRAYNIHTFTSSDDALQFLKKEGEYQDAPTPNLIITDINMPKISGLELLDFIKSTPDIKRIPVFVVSGSEDNAQIEQAYNKHANAYIMKPFGMDKLTSLIQNIENFWIIHARLPR